MKFFNKAPMAPGRNMVEASFDGKKAHVVSDDAEYIAAQMKQVIDGLLPFDPSPICIKCQSPAIATEHGSRYYIPTHPDAEQVTDWYMGRMRAHGSYHVGPEYLVRSCTVCQYTWVEHTADTNP